MLYRLLYQGMCRVVALEHLWENCQIREVTALALRILGAIAAPFVMQGGEDYVCLLLLAA
jgi:hypothetical protein